MKTYFVHSLDDLTDRLKEDGVRRINDVEWFGSEDGHGYNVMVDIPDRQELDDLNELMEVRYAN